MKLEIVNGHCVVPGWKIKVDYEDIDFSVREYIKSVDFQDGLLEEIGIKAFSGTKISKINIPSGVSNIEASAFESCNLLKSITVDKDNEWFCSKNNCCLSKDESILVFGCKASVIPDSVKIIGRNAFTYKSLKSICIPNGVKEIESDAFSGAGLTNVEIPESVEVMDKFSFSCCNDLKSFVVSPNNKHFYSKDNKCYSRDTNELIFEPESLDEILSKKNMLNSESDILSKQRQVDAYAMQVEILSPEEERKFLLRYLNILFHDRILEELHHHNSLIGTKVYCYTLLDGDIDRENCRLDVYVRSDWSGGPYYISSRDYSGGDTHNTYYLELNAPDGNSFKYFMDDYSYHNDKQISKDVAKSILEKGTVACFSIGHKEFKLDIPIPKMFDAFEFLLSEGNVPDEQVDELYDAVAFQLKAQAIKKEEREAKEAEAEIQRIINEAEAILTPQSNGSNGCYIATCVYGSYDCPEVWTLRRFRDYTLDETWYGRAFIKTYYAISPSLVKCFGKKKWFRSLFKKPLDSLVSKLRSTGVSSSPYNDKY